MVKPTQLSLALSLNDEATFTNFFSEDKGVAMTMLQQFSQCQGDSNIVVWGQAGAGLSHLLQACVHNAKCQGLASHYLPLGELVKCDPQSIVQGLEHTEVLCIDDIDTISGHASWEHALFHLYNHLKDAGRYLLMSSHLSPIELPIQLPDLKSRILGSVVYKIDALNDEMKAHAFKARAALRGMEMSDELVSFILNRAARDTRALFDILDCLDDKSLQYKRKLSIPFVKEVLSV